MGGLILATWITVPDFGLSGSIDSGWAALLGAFIGSGATSLVAVVQIRNTRKQQLFDAKRTAYGEALSLIQRAAAYVYEGRRYPGDFDEHEKLLFFNRMSALTLLAGLDVNEQRKRFNAAYPDLAFDMKNVMQRSQKYQELLEISRDIRDAMRRELGI